MSDIFMPQTVRTPVFTRYELLDELGSGGMGTVYKARQKFVGRLVAFKVLPPALRSDAEALERFEREAAALGRLKHPNVVAVFDAGIEGGFPYLAMEFVEGRNLRQVLEERGRLPVDEVVRLGVEMAEALDHVQSRGLVHRDVKPSNIILTPDGKAVLTDFGIAFATTLPRITQGAMGTPEFMSPEQADGKPLDIRSDLYSLGAVLYECLAGEVPFSREGDSLTSLSKLLNQVLHEAPARLHERRRDAPAWLSDAVHRCMAKKPDDRFQTGAELADALRRGAVREPQRAPSAARPEPEPAPPPEPPAPPKRIAAAPKMAPDKTDKTDLPAPPVVEAAPPDAGPTTASRPEPETSRTRRRPAPPASDKADRPGGWTGSFIYRSRTKPDEVPEAPPETLPAPRHEQRPDPKKPTQQPDARPRKPRAGAAFKLWFFLGLLVSAYVFIVDGIPLVMDGIPPLAHLLGTLNVLAFTPAVTGTLTTLFSRSRQKKTRVGRGIVLGTFFGTLLSLALIAAIVALVLGETYDLPPIDEEVALFVMAASAGAAAVSAVLTGLTLGFKSLLSSP